MPVVVRGVLTSIGAGHIYIPCSGPKCAEQVRTGKLLDDGELDDGEPVMPNVLSHG